MTQVVLPASIRPTTVIDASDMEGNFQAIAAVLAAGLSGGPTADGNVKIDGITELEMADDIVTPTEIAAGAVTEAKFVADTVGADGLLLKGSGRATATSSLTLTTSLVDVPGATVTTDAGITGDYLAIGVFDFEYTVAGTATHLGALSIDGVGHGSVATMEGLWRSTVAQVWSVPSLATAKVVKLRAYKTAGTGTLVLQGAGVAHTGLVLLGPF